MSYSLFPVTLMSPVISIQKQRNFYSVGLVVKRSTHIRSVNSMMLWLKLEDGSNLQTPATEPLERFLIFSGSPFQPDIRWIRVDLVCILLRYIEYVWPFSIQMFSGKNSIHYFFSSHFNGRYNLFSREKQRRMV